MNSGTKTFKAVLGFVIIGLFLWYFFVNIESFRPLVKINPAYLVGVAICYMLALLINGIFLMLIIKPFGKHISLKESTYVSVLSSIGNFFAPAGGGLGFRAVYLKKKYNLPYSSYISTLYGNYILIFICSSLAGLLGLALLSPPRMPQLYTLIIVFSGILVSSLILTLVKPLHINTNLNYKRLDPAINLVNRLITGWQKIADTKHLLLHLVLLTVAGFVLTASIVKLISVALSIPLSLEAVIILSALSSLSFILNITPANFGIKESIYAFASVMLSLSIPQALSIALIDRGVQFFVMIAMWAITSKYNYRRIKAEK